MTGEAPVRLTAADQALITICAAMTCNPTRARDRVDLWLGCIQEVLPHCRGGLPAQERLIAAAAILAGFGEVRASIEGRFDWSRALLDLQAALVAVLEWRAGLALDAVRKALAAGEAA